MKSYKPHLLKKVMGDLRKVPLGGGDHASDPMQAHKPGAHVTIVIGHGEAPKPEGSPEEGALESPAMEESEDEMPVNAPFGALKRSGHKFGK